MSDNPFAREIRTTARQALVRMFDKYDLQRILRDFADLEAHEREHASLADLRAKVVELLDDAEVAAAVLEMVRSRIGH